MTKIWVTKYALSVGIVETEGEIDDQEAGCKFGLGWHYFYGDEWHTTLEAAMERAYAMRSDRIASLKKSIAKMAKLKIKVVDKL